MYQVQKDLRTAARDALEQADREAVEAEAKAWRKQALAFWSTAAGGAEEGGKEEKQKKRHRVKVYEWLLSTDKLLQVCTSQGWVQFALPADPVLRGPPSLWPTCTVAVDQGSDGWGALHFLAYKANACVLVLKDMNHRLWNDTWLALQDAGMKPLIVMMMVVINSDHGPWQDAKWMEEAREAAWLYSRQASTECPLFEGFFEGMVGDMKLECRLGEEGLEEEVFNSLGEAVATKVPKVAGSRWFGVIDALEMYLPIWHRRLLLAVYICLQLQVFSGSATKVAATLPGETVPEGQDVQKQTTKYDSPELRALRRSCKNTLHLVAVVLSEDGILQVVRGILCLVHPHREFHTKQSLQCRSCDGCSELYLMMAMGAGMKPLVQMVALINSGRLAEAARLSRAGAWPGNAEHMEADDPAILGENLLLNRLMVLALMLLKARLRSNAWYEKGFPGRFAALYGEPGEAAKLLADMKHAREVDAAMLSQTSSMWQGVCRRSPFRILVVQRATHVVSIAKLMMQCLCMAHVHACSSYGGLGTMLCRVG